MPETRSLRVLLVDDDEAFRRIFGGALGDEGFDVATAQDGVAALDQMNHRAFDVALVDLKMPRMDGISLLAELRRRHPATVPVVLTGLASVPATVDAMRAGAFDVVNKSSPVEHVAATLRRAQAQRCRTREGTPLAESLLEHEAFFGLVGRSSAMRRVFEAVARFQQADHPVLICGETGTGKELVARALHAGGGRRDGPLIAVNCASLRENFVENELFGHVKGAFTGATGAKQGLFAIADGGTLHIDEIAEMPLDTQATLLRVLDTGRFRPLGGTQEAVVSVRVVASTNRDLERSVKEGRFRDDLFYRLCVCRIDLPPLRERREDLPLLINHCLDAMAGARRASVRVSPAAVEAMTSHDWPGNVRELFNRLERAVLLAGDREVRVEDLGLIRAEKGPAAETRPVATAPSGVDAARAVANTANVPTIEELEQGYVRLVLARAGQNVTEAARILGVDPTTLRRKLRRWGDEHET